MVPLLAAAALAIDNGYILVVRTQLQGATDAAAERIMRAVQDGETLLDAETFGRDIANKNTVIGADGQLLEEDFVFDWGGYNFDTRQFRPHSFNPTAVRVTTRRSLDLLLAPLVGTSAADVYARNVAAIGCREMMIAVDVTASWSATVAQFNVVRAALRSLINDIADRPRRGDRIGLVVFAAYARQLMPLRPMPGASSALDSWIRAIQPCSDYDDDTPPFPLHTMRSGTCGGTNHGLAIRAAVQAFDFSPSTPGCGPERVIVIVSDGPPCPRSIESFAFHAADEAASRGISISPQMFVRNHLTTPEDDCPADVSGTHAFNQALARGFGRARDSGGLPSLVNDFVPRTATEFPVRLVR
jgi:hypothetical protein